MPEALGIQSSQRLAESVERYLVTEHQIPVYRMHFVALGNAEVASAGDEEDQAEQDQRRACAVDGKQFGGPGSCITPGCCFLDWRG